MKCSITKYKQIALVISNYDKKDNVNHNLQSANKLGLKRKLKMSGQNGVMP